MRPGDHFGGQKLPHLARNRRGRFDCLLHCEQLPFDPEHDTRSGSDFTRGQVDIGSFGGGIGRGYSPGETLEFDESDRLLWHATW
jgi:hypothetical protein